MLYGINLEHKEEGNRKKVKDYLYSSVLIKNFNAKKKHKKRKNILSVRQLTIRQRISRKDGRAT